MLLLKTVHISLLYSITYLVMLKWVESRRKASKANIRAVKDFLCRWEYRYLPGLTFLDPSGNNLNRIGLWVDHRLIKTITGKYPVNYEDSILLFSIDQVLG